MEIIISIHRTHRGWSVYKTLALGLAPATHATKLAPFPLSWAEWKVDLFQQSSEYIGPFSLCIPVHMSLFAHFQWWHWQVYPSHLRKVPVFLQSPYILGMCLGRRVWYSERAFALHRPYVSCRLFYMYCTPGPVLSPAHKWPPVGANFDPGGHLTRSEDMCCCHNQVVGAPGI